VPILNDELTVGVRRGGEALLDRGVPEQLGHLGGGVRVEDGQPVEAPSGPQHHRTSCSFVDCHARYLRVKRKMTVKTPQTDTAMRGFSAP
jgi:hypothetical protein